MSRKGARHRRTSSFAWPLLAFGVVLLVLAAVLFATNRNGGAAPSAAPGTGAGGPAQIAVDPARIDYGDVKFGTNETFKIKVTNTGSEPLQFASEPYIEVLEGC